VTQVELFALQFLSPGAPATTPIEGPNIAPDRTSLLTFSSTDLLPQTPSTAYASITTTPAGVTYKHVHGATRFIYVLKGAVQITDSNGTVVYHPGDFYIEHAGDTIDAVGVTTVTVFGLTFLPRDAVDTTPLLTAVPTAWSTGSGTSASFDVNFSSQAPGQGIVYFGTGPGCSGLVETALSDAGAGTTSHTVHVTGNDLPGTVGDNGLIPGETYYFKTVTLTGGLTEVDDNNGSCYTVTIPGP
jgi:quercetin dioxygenase-like cupin family protein